MKTKIAMLFRNIPITVKDIFKSTCYRRGDTMEDAIVALMISYCNNPSNFDVRKKTRNPPRRKSRDLSGVPAGK